MAISLKNFANVNAAGDVHYVAGVPYDSSGALLTNGPTLTTDANGHTVLVGADGVGFNTINAGITDLRVTSAITGLAASTNIDVIWQEAQEDNLSAWSVGDPTKITVPAGINAMRVMAHLEWSVASPIDPATAVASYRSARIGINGASPLVPYTSAADVRAAVGTISDHQTVVLPFCRCTPGDYLTLIARHNDTTTPSVNIMATTATRFMVEWLIVKP